VGKEHANYLITCLKEKYKLTEDWLGDLYCGIKLDWNYDKHTLLMSIPGYIKKQLLKYKHAVQRVQHCPYSPKPRKYDTDVHSPLPVDNSRKLNDGEIKQVQIIVGSILYYA
jgi:hypothetical protein